MTTLVGIKATKDKSGVVLASDLVRTSTNWNQQGDFAYRQQTRGESQKIYVDNNRDFAVCMSGVFDDAYMGFLDRLVNGKIDVKAVVERGYFDELQKINLSRWNCKMPDSSYANALLLATRFDKPTLYTCWPLGAVEQRAWTSIGSGSQHALEYVQKQGLMIPYEINLRQGVNLAAEALNEAARDIYTGGLDIVVLTEDGIKEFGPQIKSSMNSAKKDYMRKIKAKL